MKTIFAGLLLIVLTVCAYGATNPDPFNVQRAQTTQASPVQPEVQVVVPPQSWQEFIRTWLNTIFAGGIMGLLAKIGFKPAAPVVPVAHVAGEAEPTTASGLLKSIADPALRAQADQAILTVIRSGIPGMDVKAAAGLIPGIGGLVGQGEPLLRKLVDDAVSARLAANNAAAEK